MDRDGLLRHYTPMMGAGSFTGPVRLLTWHCHQRQLSVIVARSKLGLKTTFERVFAEESDAMPKHYFIGNVVKPPPWFIEALRQQRYKADLHGFRSWVTHMAKEAAEAGELPPEFGPCPAYTPNPDWFNEEPSADEREMHSGCMLCDAERIVLISGAWDALFLANIEEWLDLGRQRAKRARYKEPEPPDPIEVLARPGLEADPRLPLTLFMGSAGMSSGIDFRVIKTEEDVACLWGTPLFFFQGQKHAPPKKMIEAIQAFRQAEKRARQAQEAERARRNEEERAARRTQLLAMLERVK